MTTGKTIALTRRNFVGKVMSLRLNMLSILVTAFLPRKIVGIIVGNIVGTIVAIILSLVAQMVKSLLAV